VDVPLRSRGVVGDAVEVLWSGGGARCDAVVMKSEQEAHGGGRSGQQLNGKCPSPRVRHTL